MTQIDEPNLDELRQLLYSHSFAVETYPKDFVLRINEKGVDDILQATKALIATQIQEARIDELEEAQGQLIEDTPSYIEDRLAQLRSTPNE